MREKPNHDYYRQQLAQSEERLRDLQERGADALSSYDINIAHGGDAEQALRTAKWLVGNHVAYFRANLEQLGPEVKQHVLFELPEDPTRSQNQ